MDGLVEESATVILPSGLQLQDVRVGSGAQAASGDRCAVHYRGWVLGGADPFDSTSDEPFRFRLKKGEVIEGWLEGVSGMRVGGIRRLQVPAPLAYGDEGRDGVIAPGATLCFEIELVSAIKRSPGARMLLSPHARVRWRGSDIELYVPREPRIVEASDPRVLLIVHAFSVPSLPAEIAGRFPDVPVEDVEAIVDELEAAGVLIAEAPGPSQGESPAPSIPRSGPEGQAGSATVLFVLPPNLSGYGWLGIPSAFSFLASLAARDGLSTDFLLATSAPALPSSPTRTFVGPDAASTSPILFLQAFARELLDRVALLRAGGAKVVVGFSCFSSALYPSCMILAALCRARFPDLPIMVGGCHATIAPESLNARPGSQTDLLQDESRWRPVAGELFAALDAATASVVAAGDFVFDVVFSGRADGTFLPSVRALVGEGRPAQPRILSAAPLSDVELAAFDYDRNILERLAKAHLACPSDSARPFPISFSFGCPYACAFCINSKTHERWQGMAVSRALGTLEFLHLTCGIRRFSLMDANFAARTSWRQAFFAGLAGKPWIDDIQIDTETAVTNWELEDYRVLDRLSLTLQIGLESCAPEMLVRMEKCKRPSTYLASLRALIETLAPRVDHISLMMIFGYPGETRQTLKQTLAYLIDECQVLSHSNVEICPQIYLPLLGTRASERTAEFRSSLGYRPNRVDWWNCDAADRFVDLRPSHSLSVETCCRLVDVITRYFRGVVASGADDGAADDEATTGEPVSLCATMNHSKLEQRELRADLWRILDELSTSVP